MSYNDNSSYISVRLKSDDYYSLMLYLYNEYMLDDVDNDTPFTYYHLLRTAINPEVYDVLTRMLADILFENYNDNKPDYIEHIGEIVSRNMSLYTSCDIGRVIFTPIEGLLLIEVHGI